MAIAQAMSLEERTSLIAEIREELTHPSEANKKGSKDIGTFPGAIRYRLWFGHLEAFGYTYEAAGRTFEMIRDSRKVSPENLPLEGYRDRSLLETASALGIKRH